MEGLLNYLFYQAGATEPVRRDRPPPALLDLRGRRPAPAPTTTPAATTVGVPDSRRQRPDHERDEDQPLRRLARPEPAADQAGLELPPYDPSVCPDGSTDTSLCDPNGTAAQCGDGAAALGEEGAARQRRAGLRKPAPATAPPGRLRRRAATVRHRRRRRPVARRAASRTVLTDAGKIGDASAGSCTSARPPARGPAPAGRAPAAAAGAAAATMTSSATCSGTDGGTAQDKPARGARRLADDDRRDHDPDRGRRRVPRLQREQRPAVRARPTGSTSTSRTPPASSQQRGPDRRPPRRRGRVDHAVRLPDRTSDQGDGRNKNNEVDADTSVDPAGGVVARLGLKLDEIGAPIPDQLGLPGPLQSAFGLKYLEITRGDGPGGAAGLRLRRHRRQRRAPTTTTARSSR